MYKHKALRLGLVGTRPTEALALMAQQHELFMLFIVNPLFPLFKVPGTYFSYQSITKWLLLLATCWFNRPRLNRNISVQATSLNQQEPFVLIRVHSWLICYRFSLVKIIKYIICLLWRQFADFD